MDLHFAPPPLNMLRYSHVRTQWHEPHQQSFADRQDVKGGNGSSADAAASKALSTRKPRRGVALQELLKLLLSIAGPKILTLVGLALARTALSNRLARLQV